VDTKIFLFEENEMRCRSLCEDAGISKKMELIKYGLKKNQNFEIIVIDVTNGLSTIGYYLVEFCQPKIHKRGRNL
jgi:hypothetical protein